MAHCAGAYSTFYRWLIFFGLVVFGAFAAFHHDLFAALFGTDNSYLSAVILALFLIASLDAGRRAWRLGNELCTAMQLSQRAQTKQLLFEHKRDEDLLRFVDAESGDSFAHHHVLLLANKTVQHGTLCSQDLLLERLETTLGRGHETGWFIADLMIRLGLLGTVIGFIFMLGSVAHVSSVDIHALQQLLTNMSGGMRIALYTTLTGLGAGILLGFQYRLLDSAVDRLMAEIIELAEVHITSQLRRLLEV
ncbi:MotA/TolQ/ExbB proton channel family protein [Thiosocius teredinicola]|uniref:MotA/TolQ/ExbB proton channel family protein n=1 Tax=Thiosocius teredinicola TaxID=1973002 RepID=UPI000990FBAD